MWIYPKIVAHRGGGILAPENTLAAMRCGLRHGFRAVEFDVMLSADQVPVVVHDPIFGRTIAGEGKVSETTAQALMSMDVGTWFGPEFASERLPSFEQVASYCKENGLWMNVEIKPASGYEEQTGRIVAEAAQRFFKEELSSSHVGAALLPLLSSFSVKALRAAKLAAPAVARAYLVDKIPADWREKLHALDAKALHTNHKNLSPTQAQNIKEEGFGLFCYTVNDPTRAREILSWGVDAFCTDLIDVIGPDFA